MDHNPALKRLRIGFVLLGSVLLLPLFFVLRQAEARFEEQRRLRHEIVAERIFDEMERELAQLLEGERARPSSAYDAESTRVASWAPFVVGYFTRDARGTELVAREQLSAARSARVARAVQAVWGRGEQEQVREATERAAQEAAQAVRQMQAAPQSANQQEVLRQLNRARKQAPVSKQRAPHEANHSVEDPLMGL